MLVRKQHERRGCGLEPEAAITLGVLSTQHYPTVGQALCGKQPRIRRFTLLAVVNQKKQLGASVELRELIAKAKASVDMTATASSVHVVAATHGKTTLACSQLL